MHYDKLVWHRRPDIMAQRGLKPVTLISEPGAYAHGLRHKPQEDVAEYGQSARIEETGYILEVVYPLAVPWV